MPLRTLRRIEDKGRKLVGQRRTAISRVSINKGSAVGIHSNQFMERKDAIEK